MFLGEYDYETDVRVQREEAFASGLKEGMDKGIEQGMQKGLEKGAYQNALHTALAMKQKNFNAELIAEMTGLPVKEIEQL